MRTAGTHVLTTTEAQLFRLVYELVDAHDDTARLAAETAQEHLAWEIHLDYLRDLQRVAREQLAQIAA